jgi:hypothetical protein
MNVHDHGPFASHSRNPSDPMIDHAYVSGDVSQATFEDPMGKQSENQICKQIERILMTFA